MNLILHVILVPTILMFDIERTLENKDFVRAFSVGKAVIAGLLGGFLLAWCLICVLG